MSWHKDEGKIVRGHIQMIFTRPIKLPNRKSLGTTLIHLPIWNKRSTSIRNALCGNTYQHWTPKQCKISLIEISNSTILSMTDGDNRDD